MTRRRWARACLTAALMYVSSRTQAGVWVSEPVLGLSGDYSTNPGLRYVDHTAETHAALLIDAPTYYYADAFKFTVLPSVRISDSEGYSSLASDYEHLTLIAEITGERNSLKATAQAARDSSLYYNYNFNGSTGVRRDTLLADVDWTRSLSERLNLDVDVDSTRVLYGQSVSYTTLTDYRYTSGAVALSWNTSERTALTFQSAIGDYQALDGTTQSFNSNLQLGFKRQFNELWSASLSAGTSRESDKIKTPFETLESTESGSVYAANVSRQARLLTLTAQASRSLIPSGYAFLSRQESYQVSASYPRTERWTFGGYARWLRSKNPQFSGPAIDQSYVDLGLSAVWLFTERWTVTLLASYVTTDVSPPQHHAEASGCSIQLARHFNRIEWH